MTAAAPTDLRPRIVVEDLHKSFGGKPVLRGVNLTVLHGEALVVLGSSGVGKSVLLKHLIGLIQPDRGRVVIDGQDMSRAGAAAWGEVRRRFGMAFQEGALFDSLNVFDNVAFPLRRHTKLTETAIRARVKECLALVQLEGVEGKLPNQLSGGMKRRAGFARAIAVKPEILLFDEPNTGLDPITAAVIDRYIIMLRQQLQSTTVTITHDTRSAFRIGDRIAMLHEGRIAAIGPPDQFRSIDDPYIQRFLHGEPLDEEVA